MKFEMYSEFKNIAEMNDAYNTFQTAGTLDQSKDNNSLPMTETGRLKGVSGKRNKRF